MMKDFDPDLDPGPVPSPCIDVCRMDPKTGFYAGCLRTIEEITRWSTATDDIKRAVWVEIRNRKDALFG
jgi:uncharacterized protein